MAIQLLMTPLYIRSFYGGLVLFESRKLAEAAFHMNVTSMQSWILPLEATSHANLSQFCVNKRIAASVWPFLKNVADFTSVIFPDAESKESSIIYGSGWSHGGEGVKISVWWDFENCNVPNGFPAHKLTSNILSALRTSGFKGPVTIAAYGDTLQLSRSMQEALSSTGIQIHHIPSGGKESDSSDRALLVDLILWTMDNPPPAHLLLISGDRDFSNALHRLRMRNYNILLACPTGAHISSTLLGAASNVWQWNNLVRGEGLLAKSYFECKPSDGSSAGSFSLKGLNSNPKTPDTSSGSSGGIKNSNVKTADGVVSIFMPKINKGNTQPSDAPAVGQTLKGSSVEMSAPPSPSRWNALLEDESCKVSNQSKIEPTNSPPYSDEKSFGGKLEKDSEEKMGKWFEEKQDNTLERTFKMEHSVPSRVLQQLDELLKSHPQGIWMAELQPLLGEIKLQFDSDYYGHKKLVPFLLTIPEIVRVERRIAKDRKTWMYFLFSSRLSSRKSQRHLGDTLVPPEISRQLIGLLRSHPSGLWLNEFQAQLAAHNIEFDSDFYGHHKIVPFLLSMPEIVRVERRLMNDKKTWTFFICSQGLSVNERTQLSMTSSSACQEVSKELHDPFTSSNDVELKMKYPVCKEKHSKKFQVEGLDKDYALIEPSEEPRGGLDTSQSGRKEYFWKRPWQILSRYLNGNSHEHGLVACNQARRNPGNESQAGKKSIEQMHLNQQTQLPSGSLKRLFKGSTKDTENAQSTKETKQGGSDTQPSGEFLEKGHILEKGEKAEDMNIQKGSHHPENESLLENVEDKNSDGNHWIGWKEFLLWIFKATRSLVVGSNGHYLQGINVEKMSHPVLRSYKLHERSIVGTGVHQASHSQIESSMKNKSSNKAAAQNFTIKVTTESSANTSSLLVSQVERLDNPCLLEVSTEINQTCPKVANKVKDQVVCNDDGISQEALHSHAESQKVSDSSKTDPHVQTKNTKNFMNTVECCSLVVVGIDKATIPHSNMPLSGPDVLSFMKELPTQPKGTPLSLASPCIKDLVDSKAG